MFKFFIHTHTDCHDIWVPFFGELNKYFSDYEKNVIVNKPDSFLSGYNLFTYNPDSHYTSRIIEPLSTFKDDIILFTHEDMILYDKPMYDILEEFCELIKNDKADFIKLLKCANVVGNYDFPASDVHRNLSPCPKQYSFTIQPTLCKASKLLDVFSSCTPTNIWDFENKIESIFSNYIHNKCFMSSFEGEAKRGQAHWDSKCYPHGNMIFKGKWTYGEYSKEIDYLCKEYGVDFKIRGVV
tara:strand:- start:238 stop:957 length:720 start_codon:yes stop_codon:yes gene_type:complete